MSFDFKSTSEERANALRNVDRLVELKGKEKREWTAEEKQEFDKSYAEADRLYTLWKDAKSAEGLNKELESRKFPNDLGGDSQELEKRNKPVISKDLEKRYSDVFWKKCRDPNNLTQADRVVVDEYRAASNMVATGGHAGADFFPVTFADSFNLYLKYYKGMREVSTIYTVPADAGVWHFPTLDDTAQTGEVTAEASAVEDDSTKDPLTGGLVLDVWFVDSGMRQVSRKLLSGSKFPVDQWLGQALFIRLARQLNNLYTNGNGSQQPTGILNSSSGANSGATAASATALTYQDLLNLMGSIDWAYQDMPNTGWMFHQNTLFDLRGLVDLNHRPIFLTDYGNIAGAVPQQLCGKKYSINNHFPSALTANAKSIIYGDLGQYIIRDIEGGFQLLITEHRYAELMMIGYLAYYATDGGLINPNAVKYLAQASS